MSNKYTGPDIALMAITGLGFVYLFYKGSVTGYYPDETNGLAFVGAVTAICAFALSRRLRQRNLARMAQQDRDRGVE